MGKSKKRLLSMFLIVAMLLITASGCSKKNNTDTSVNSVQNNQATEEGKSEEGKSEEEVVITIWNKDVVSAGIQNNAVADEIAKKTGVRIQVVNGDAQKFKVLLAGEDLPDIIHSSYGDLGVDINSLRKSGQLIPLDDLIDQYSPNIKNNYTSRLDYSRDFLSDDGKVYFLPIQTYKSDPNNQVIAKTGADLAIYTRYDLYKELGSPEIKTTDDYLNVLKQMQDAHPQTESGKKTYAISGWSDWGTWMYIYPYQMMNGVTKQAYGMMYDKVTNEPMGAYYSDAFWDGIKFYNKAYNMGILDPEIFTQKYDNYMDKIKEGQTFVTYASWIADPVNSDFVAAGKPEQGFEIIPTGLNYIYGVYVGDAPFGWGGDYAMAITKNCKNQEKAMELLDFLYSDEGARLMNSGVEGVHWEYVDGVPKMKQEYYDGVAADPNYLDLQGLKYNKLCTLSGDQILSDGYPADLRKTNEEKAKAINPIDKEFIADSGVADATFPGQVIANQVESGKYITRYELDLIPGMVKEPSDDIKTKSATVDEELAVAITQVIMASEDNYEAEKQKVIDTLNSKGYDKVVDEMLKLWGDAKEAAKNYNY